MDSKKIIQHALVDALAAIAYIAVVVVIMNNLEKIFGGKPDSEAGYLAPALFLLLFVTSAAVMGTTIFGRPALWYLDGKKSEAVKLVLYTIGCLALATVLVLVAVAIQNS